MNAALRNLRGKVVLLIALSALSHSTANAEGVYKCVEGGKTRFTSIPQEAVGCQALAVDTTPLQPSQTPLPTQRSRTSEDKAEAARTRELIENDPDATRRNQSVELAKSLARQPVIMPYWGGNRRGKWRQGYGIR